MAEIKDKIITVESLKAVYDTLNESKAPSGYGLGEPQLAAPENNNANNAIRNGSYTVYQSTANTPDVADGVLTVKSRAYGYTEQELILVAQTSSATNIAYHGCELRRNQINEVWGEWEWVNPPMLLNVEYRTTERWQGKAVYTKLIDVGVMPNTDTKSIRVFDEGTNLTNIKMIDMSGIGISSESGAQQIYPIVTWSQGAAVYAQYHSGTGYLSVLARQDMRSYSGVFKLKYTKD